MKTLPSSALLDQMILLYRPRPELIGSEPGATTLETLGRERNLYAASLYAATGDPSDVLKRPEANKERVQRAIAHNPRLSRPQRNKLARIAIERRSGALALAIMEGSRQITTTLKENQGLLDLVSTKSGQHAPDAIARNLRHASVTELESLIKHFETRAERRKDAPFRALIEDACWTILRDISDGKIRVDVETLCGLCRVYDQGGFGHLHLPRPVYAQLEKLPGRIVLPLARVFNVHSYYRDEEPDPLGNAWEHTRTKALACQLGAESGISDKRNLARWCQPAIEDTAAILVRRLQELEQLQTFEALLPEWSGTLAELLDTSITV